MRETKLRQKQGACKFQLSLAFPTFMNTGRCIIQVSISNAHPGYKRSQWPRRLKWSWASWPDASNRTRHKDLQVHYGVFPVRIPQPPPALQNLLRLSPVGVLPRSRSAQDNQTASILLSFIRMYSTCIKSPYSF